MARTWKKRGILRLPNIQKGRALAEALRRRFPEKDTGYQFTATIDGRPKGVTVEVRGVGSEITEGGMRQIRTFKDGFCIGFDSGRTFESPQLEMGAAIPDSDESDRLCTCGDPDCSRPDGHPATD